MTVRTTKSHQQRVPFQPFWSGKNSKFYRSSLEANKNVFICNPRRFMLFINNYNYYNVISDFLRQDRFSNEHSEDLTPLLEIRRVPKTENHQIYLIDSYGVLKNSVTFA